MLKRAAMGVLAVLLAVPMVVASVASSASAEGDPARLQLKSTTTYSIDAGTGEVHVRVDLEFLSTYRGGCGQRERLAFTHSSIPVPIESSKGLATANGRSLQVKYEPIPDSADFQLLAIEFDEPLICGEVQIVVTYDLLGNAPRSDHPSRINPAYAYFSAFGVGDKATIRVVVPPGVDSEIFDDSVATTKEGQDTVYTATDIRLTYAYSFLVFTTHDHGLDETAATTDAGDEFIVRSVPGDSEWQTFITKQIEDGVPALVDLIGQPWPIDEPIEVRESYAPYLQGYSGHFDAASFELELGEELDPTTTLHELSRAWFNESWFTDRWLIEGLAQLYASKTAEQLGGDASTPLTISNNAPGNIPLNEWAEPTTSSDEDVEAYGSNASFYVVQQIADEIGDDQMRKVLDAVADGDTATDWRRFLDLVEEVGGSTDAADLFADYVVTAEEESLFAERVTARALYNQLGDDGAAWTPPAVVRDRMAEWNFAEATELMAAAQAVLALRNQLDTKVAELGIAYSSDLEMLYEGADDLDAVAAAVQQQIETADALSAATQATERDDGLFGTVGLIGADPDKTLEEAKAAFAVGNLERARELASDVNEQVSDAPGAGKLRATLVIAALLIIGFAVFWQIRRRRGRTVVAEV